MKARLIEAREWVSQQLLDRAAYPDLLDERINANMALGFGQKALELLGRRDWNNAVATLSTLFELRGVVMTESDYLNLVELICAAENVLGAGSPAERVEAERHLRNALSEVLPVE